ncbi:HepT-like ribonuclease domain-containing protein [Cyclobacterium roseum]|uniref:HepT-like ribonuclease domain-containing protein n=1 Tax=Cyclobacterium roseum TaxID=2666137 RepID=UPI00192EFEF2|nr:HepT-like ribonuclease domain-containing protein [Cyclobacterium roseum]
MSKRDVNLLLEDMLESAKKIKRYTADLSFEDFLKDEKTIDAVVRNFEIIGEAANRIDPDFRTNNSGIQE